MEQDNEQQQEEERWVIRVIFGDSILQRDEHYSTLHQTAYLLTVDLEDDRVMVFRLFFPSTYPSAHCPVFEVISLYCGSTKIDASMVDTIQHRFQTLFQPGQVVLYDWIQWLREYIQDHTKGKRAATVAAVVAPAPILSMEEQEKKAISDDDLPSIFSSESLVDRKSVFVAHIAAVKSPKDVNRVMSALLANKKIARATHNIMAYRIQLLKGSILQDHDDDGETAAGGDLGRLLHLLQILDVKDVLVVVSRWFGGILLGPDRFKDINNCARQALDVCGYLPKKAAK